MVEAHSVIRLGDIAHARSGDKGSHANIGVIAYTKQGFDFLGTVLTEERVAQFFEPMGPKRVVRYPLPGVHAYNFMLIDILKGGASGSLRTDNQGKVLSLALLEMELPVPPDADAMRRPAGAIQTHG